MREKKYAGVLDNNVNESKNTQEDITEELSMTRELKFKDLQEKIDTELVDYKKDNTDVFNNDSDLSKKTELSVTDDTKENDSDEDKNKENDSVIVNKTDDVEQVKDEDIYLTTSFKPFRKRFRLKKVFKVLFTMILLIACGLAFTYFVVLPFYNMYQNSRPKAIFEGSIDYIANSFIDVINKGLDDTNSGLLYEDINFKIDTNISELSFLSSSTLGYRYAVNSKDRIYEEFIYVKDDNDKYGVSYIEQQGKSYVKVSSSDNYLFYGDVDEEEDNLFYQVINEYLESMASIKKEDMVYFIEKERDVLKELFLDKYFSFEKDEIEINGEDFVVIKNSFSLDGKSVGELLKRYNELLLKDDKYLEILAEINEMSVSEVKEIYFAEIEEIEEEYSLVFNIYTVNGINVVGFDIEGNGFRDIYAYFKDGNFDVHLNLTTNEDCLEGNDCVLSDMFVIDLYGENKDTYTDVTIKYNDQELAKLEIKSFDLEKIDFDYTINYEEESIRGDFLMMLDFENNLYCLDLSSKFDDNYIDLNLNMDFGEDNDFGYVNDDKVINYTEKKLENEVDDLCLKLKELGLLDVYDFWFEFLNELTLEDVETSTGDIFQEL